MAAWIPGTSEGLSVRTTAPGQSEAWHKVRARGALSAKCKGGTSPARPCKADIAHKGNKDSITPTCPARQGTPSMKPTRNRGHTKNLEI